MRRFVLPLIAAAVLVSAVGYWVFADGDSAVAYRFAEVDNGPIVSIVSAAGTVHMRKTIPVVAEVPGTVTEVSAQFNAPVKAGDVLASLNGDALANRLAVATANLAVARGALDVAEGEADLAKRRLDSVRAAADSARAVVKSAGLALGDAERDLGIKQDLASTGDVSPVETQRAGTAKSRAEIEFMAAKARERGAAAELAAGEAQLQVGEARLASARASVAASEVAVRQATLELQRSVIRSPVDGLVMAKDVVVGQSVSPGQPLFTIAEDLSSIEVHARVGEADIGRIVPGQAADFGFGAFPGRRFEGRVSDIRRMPQIAEGVVTYVVVVEAQNQDERLLQGMTAELRIVVDSRTAVVRVPKAALRFVPAADATRSSGARADRSTAPGEVVWTKGAGDELQPIPVVTGISDGVYTEVVTGDLRPGQEVVVGMVNPDRRSSGGPLRF